MANNTNEFLDIVVNMRMQIVKLHALHETGNVPNDGVPRYTDYGGHVYVSNEIQTIDKALRALFEIGVHSIREGKINEES